MTPLTLLSGLLLGFHLLIQSVSSIGDVLITYPETGGVVEGLVEIRGTVPAEDFATARVAYSYMGDEDNWFLISRVEQPVEDEILAVWDTTTITDGIYQLRLTVKSIDGSKKEIIVKDLRVANYSHLAFQPEAVGEVTETQPPSNDRVTSTMPTALPSNPASIDDSLFSRTMLIGGLSGFAIVIVYIILTLLKNRYHSR